MRIKMKCTSVTKDRANHEIVGLVAVGSEDSAAHMDSQASLRISEAKHHGHFEPDKEYVVDVFEVAPAVEAKQA